MTARLARHHPRTSGLTAALPSEKETDAWMRFEHLAGDS